MNKKLRKRAAKVGDDLVNTLWALRELFGEINMANHKQEYQEQVEKDLDTLNQVRQLVEIAAELYPFDIEE